jgi:hypothetical protein
VRKWEPSDRTFERLRSNSPQVQQIQSIAYNQKSTGGFPQQKKQERFQTQFEVDSFIGDDFCNCTRRDIADLLRISAKVSKRNRKVSFLKKHLPTILIQLKKLSLSTWNFQEISGVVYGLQFMTTNDLGVIDIISIMTAVATKSIKNVDMRKRLRGQNISMMLYGLQNMNSKEMIVNNLSQR